jgi:hypothetical protein
MFRLAFLGLLVWSLSPAISYGAYLYIDPGEVSLLRGDSAIFTIRIDTDENECINTIDATLEYDEGVRAVDVSSGDSILNVWVEPPTINHELRTVTLAGGLPGGYCGRALGDPGLSNVVASIVFQSPGFAIGGDAIAAPRVRFSDTTRVLLNDGLGTDANLRTSEALITLLNEPGEMQNNAWGTQVSDDKTPPADFTITLSREETAFSNQYFVSWNSADKQTGIDHYEIMEEPLEDLYAFTWGRADAPWKTAESPYVLVDQTLNSTIRVKAIDKAGNETISVLIPNETLRTLSQNRIITLSLVAGVTFISLLLIGYVLFARKRQLLAQRNEGQDS